MAESAVAATASPGASQDASQMIARPEPTELLWVDCEMTGLEEKDQIIEFAAIATDGNLNPFDEGINFIIKTDKAVLDNMNEWCVEQHGSSGLTAACLSSKMDLEQVDQIALAYARKHIPHGRILLAGSSVHVDKIFLKKDFPRLSKHLHYRVLDVSSVKEITRRWYPDWQSVWKSKGESSHRALDDIKASIEELKRYRALFFKDAASVTDAGLADELDKKAEI